MEANGQARVLEPIRQPNEPLSFEKGKVFDAHGITVQPQTHKGFMTKMDEKGKEQITLSKSTLWLMGAGVVVLQLAFNYGGSAVSWIRDDQSDKVKLATIESDLKDLKTNFSNFQTSYTNDRIADAKATGYKLGQGDSGHPEPKK